MNLRHWPANRFTWAWGLLFLLVAACHVVSFDFRHQPIATDVECYLYYAQQSAQGALPYVDYFEHKTPLAIYVGAWLYRLGEILEVDPLYAIRVGYLVLAGLAAAVMGLIFVRLYEDRPAAGLIGLLVYSGFGLLGMLPAIGNLPKMIGLLGACSAMLMVHRRRWFWAGLLVGIAGMDWQPCGALAGLGTLLGGAYCSGRVRNWVKSVAGMVVPALALSVYFAARGALGTFWEMILFFSLTKARTDESSLTERFERICKLITDDCPGEMWLILLGVIGVAFFLIRLTRMRRTGWHPMVIGLAVYHYGVVAFTLVDVQGHADIFILLGSWAFFAAVPVAEAYCALLGRRRHLKEGRARVHGPALRVLIVLILVAASRPSFLREGWRFNSPRLAPESHTLENQRQAAQRFSQVIGDRRFSLVRNHELLFLSGRTCSTYFVTWNVGTFALFRQGAESRADTLSRLLRDEDLDVIVLPRPWLPYLYRTRFAYWLLPHYMPVLISSDDMKYNVVAWLHQRVPPAAVRGVRYLRRELYLGPAEGGPEP